MSMLVEPPPMTAGERSRGDSSSGSSTTEPIAARVKRYSATINASVSKRQLSKLKLAVHEEAKEAFENTEFDVALEGFAHAVALNDAAGPDPDFRSALCYNIASCLHFMHDLELAKAASPPPRRLRRLRLLTGRGQTTEARAPSRRRASGEALVTIQVCSGDVFGGGRLSDGKNSHEKFCAPPVINNGYTCQVEVKRFIKRPFALCQT